MISISEQAPFGRGEDTVTDNSVRNCWQIDASQFEISNPMWDVAMKNLADLIAAELGLYDCEVIFEPYKLLTYETGSFFVRHRDTEKMPAMFATCVINLPSAHQGGELIVSHGDKRVSVSFADNDLFSSGFAAFYADCYHEIKPITAGHRICLVYNLAIKNRKQQPLFNDSLVNFSAVCDVLDKYASSNAPQPLIAYLLEHHYTEQNLSLNNLKGNDHNKAHTLMQAAKSCNFEAYLCLVTYYRNSYGDVSYGNMYDDAEEEDFEEFDIAEQYIKASTFIGLDPQSAPIGDFEISDQELLAKVSLCRTALH